MSFKKQRFTEEFKQEAVHIALTSGRTRDTVAENLGLGKSTLGCWVRLYRLQGQQPAPGFADIFIGC